MLGYASTVKSSNFVLPRIEMELCNSCMTLRYRARGIPVWVNGIEGYAVKFEGLEDDGIRTPIILNRVNTGLQRPLEPLSRAKATLI